MIQAILLERNKRDGMEILKYITSFGSFTNSTWSAIGNEAVSQK